MNVKSKILFALIASSISIFGAALPECPVPGLQSPLAKDKPVIEQAPDKTIFYKGASLDMPNITTPNARVGANSGQGRTYAEKDFGIRYYTICPHNNPFLTFLSWLNVKLLHLDCIVHLWASNQNYHWIIRSILPWITWLVVHLPIEAATLCLSLFLVDVAIGGVTNNEVGPRGKAETHSLLDVTETPFLCEVRVICSKSLFHEWKNGLENDVEAYMRANDTQYTKEQLLHFAFVNSFLELKQGEILPQERQSEVIKAWESAKVRRVIRIFRDAVRIISEPNASREDHIAALAIAEKIWAENKELVQSWFQSFNAWVQASIAEDPESKPLPHQFVEYVRECLGTQQDEAEGVEQAPVIQSWPQVVQVVGQEMRDVARREIDEEITRQGEAANTALQTAIAPLELDLTNAHTVSDTVAVMVEELPEIIERSVEQRVENQLARRLNAANTALQTAIAPLELDLTDAHTVSDTVAVIVRDLPGIMENRVNDQIIRHSRDLNAAAQRVLVGMGFQFRNAQDITSTLENVTDQGTAVLDRYFEERAQRITDALINQMEYRLRSQVNSPEMTRLLDATIASVQDIVGNPDQTVALVNASNNIQKCNALLQLMPVIAEKTVCMLHYVQAFNFIYLFCVMGIIRSALLYLKSSNYIMVILDKSPNYIMVILDALINFIPVLVGGCLVEQKILNGVRSGIRSLPYKTKRICGELCTQGQEISSSLMQTVKDKASSAWSWVKNKASQIRCPHRGGSSTEGAGPTIEEMEE